MFVLTTLNTHFICLVCQFELNSQNVCWILTAMATKNKKNKKNTKNVLKQQKNRHKIMFYYISSPS